MTNIKPAEISQLHLEFDVGMYAFSFKDGSLIAAEAGHCGIVALLAESIDFGIGAFSLGAGSITLLTELFVMTLDFTPDASWGRPPQAVGRTRKMAALKKATDENVTDFMRATLLLRRQIQAATSISIAKDCKMRITPNTMNKFCGSVTLAFVLISASCTNDETQVTSSATSSNSGAGGANGSSSSSSSGGGEAGNGGGGQGGGGQGGGGSDVEPPKPAALVDYIIGNAEDMAVTPTGPGLILMGGGTDVDEAFHWAKPKIAGGDIVVLRTSGADGYNSYLFTDIGQADSVETMLVTTKELANDPYVIWKIKHAESVFLAGGDQATYLKAWKDQGVEMALQEAWNRGAVIGGTSAGCAVLGELMFAAYNDTVYSNEALTDPYNMYMTMERDFLSFSPLFSTITDTHFAERDRMGRLVAFLGRLVTDGWADVAKVRGIGIDEKTALVVDENGLGKVLGSGAVYVVEATKPPAVCQAGMNLDFSGLTYKKLVAGNEIKLPLGETAVPSNSLSVGNGKTVPANPY